jgi:hypothetical protein
MVHQMMWLMMFPYCGCILTTAATQLLTIAHSALPLPVPAVVVLSHDHGVSEKQIG